MLNKLNSMMFVFCLSLAACAEGENAPAIPQESFEQPPAGVATAATRAANASFAASLPLEDQADFEDASRGFLAKIEDDAILSDNGAVVWNIRQFDFLTGAAPATVNPSLWRQAKLASQHGLFQVTEGIWQVRGYDLAVMTIIEGRTGWIIVDPLTTVETAAAALGLANSTLGTRPVSAVIYTHSHVDHFGGARGVINEEDIAARGVPVIAPAGFADHAITENVLAGNHMSRRAILMFGSSIARGETAHVSSGLGPGLPRGSISLVLPTEEVRSGTRIIDGVTFEFIDAAGTEAPAEFMFYLPEKRALCTAEVASGTFHNVLTPRGAKVRDALAWSRVIDSVLAEYGDRSDVVFASHHWPTWGAENVRAHLTGQRDIYRYVHDQTLRQANTGATMTEAAETLKDPSFAYNDFSTRGYYGTLNHNAKAVYQHYFGWWSGNPSDYHALPSEVTASRYVEAMGGSSSVLELGKSAFEQGDYRWAAELLNHLVFADPADAAARDWLAATFEQLGFQTESGAWRSYYLVAASELRNGLPEGLNPQLSNPEFVRAVPTMDLFNAMAARFNPAKMNRQPYVINFVFSDTDEQIAVHVSPDVIVPRSGAAAEPKASVQMSRETFDSILLGTGNVPALTLSGKIYISGDALSVRAFLNSLDQPAFWFPIVTP